ncbi:MAG: DRTGG domain-containing protein [SAR202 cluster bacterium]|nr:DRTGG domain-containing protein [SAR202 cluster bacterium]
MSVLFVTSTGAGSGKTFFSYSLSQSLINQNKIVDLVHLVPDQQNDLFDGNYVPDLLPSKILPVSQFNSFFQEIDQSISLIVKVSDQISRDDLKNLVQNSQGKIVSLLDFSNCVDQIDHLLGLDDQLAGVVINFVTKYGEFKLSEEILPAFLKANISVLGTIPENRTLLSLSVQQISDILGAKFFNGNDYSNQLVEHYMVGGFGMDPGEMIFNTLDDKAVIVRGDRPDVQMSALSTEMSCFIMTGGLEPIEYVKYEANEEQVPVLVVDSNTLDTMDRINEIQNFSKFDHPKKLNVGCELVTDNFNFEVLS